MFISAYQVDFNLPVLDSRMFIIEYLEMHAGAISELVCGFASVRARFHSLKLVDYLPVQIHKPYNNLHFYVNRKV